MTLRTTGTAAVCAAALLTAPAVASAAPTTIVAGPLKVKKYSMTVTATDNGASDGLSVIFNRTAGKASQTHFYSFTKSAKITTKPSLAAARIKADLGKYGKVDMKLTGVGAARRGTVPKGCTGTAGKMRAGTLAGRYKLVADKTYFKTISAKSLRARLFKGGSLKCDSSGSGGDGAGGGSARTMLSSTIQRPDGMLTFSATKDASGSIAQQATRIDTAAGTAPATVMHMISAPGSGSAFTFAGDLSRASGSAITPFFSGTFGFASDMAMGSMATGTLSGTFAARFDSIGTQQIAAGSPDAMLMKG